MNRFIQYSLIATGLIFVILIALVVYIFFKPHSSLQNQKPEVIIEAVELCQQYQQDESAANTLFLNKVIEIQGKVYSVSEIAILAGDEKSIVNCGFDPGYKISSDIKTGDNIRIKGICTGLTLTDVCLTNCIVLQ